LKDRSLQLFIDVDFPLRDQKQHLVSVGDRSSGRGQDKDVEAKAISTRYAASGVGK
jgi:hypothetical protein